MSALADDWALCWKFHEHGVRMASQDVRILRRAERTLRRWHERECGTKYGCIDYEEDGKPVWVSATTGESRPILDTKTRALRRVAEVCARYHLYYYVQGDPRGPALWIGTVPLDCASYAGKGFSLYV